jgi:hypothetical protein
MQSSAIAENAAGPIHTISMTHIEKWARQLTTVIFIGAGIYLLLKNLIGF